MHYFRFRLLRGGEPYEEYTPSEYRNPKWFYDLYQISLHQHTRDSCYGMHTIMQFFPCKDQTSLVGWRSLLLLNHLFNIQDSIRGLHEKSNSYIISAR